MTRLRVGVGAALLSAGLAALAGCSDDKAHLQAELATLAQNLEKVSAALAL